MHQTYKNEIEKEQQQEIEDAKMDFDVIQEKAVKDAKFNSTVVKAHIKVYIESSNKAIRKKTPEETNRERIAKSRVISGKVVYFDTQEGMSSSLSSSSSSIVAPVKSIQQSKK